MTARTAVRTDSDMEEAGHRLSQDLWSRPAFSLMVNGVSGKTGNFDTSWGSAHSCLAGTTP